MVNKEANKMTIKQIKSKMYELYIDSDDPQNYYELLDAIRILAKNGLITQSALVKIEDYDFDLYEEAINIAIKGERYDPDDEPY